MAACSASGAPSATSSPNAEPADRPTCPNPEGGACLGLLDEGEYTTDLLELTLTYEVPDGWTNYEDTMGNFLLVPPGNSLEGVSDGSSNYIGVYTNVLPASDCAWNATAEVPSTPRGFSSWLTFHKGVSVTKAINAQLGGLSGILFDLRISTTWDKTCAHSDGKPFVPLMVGKLPSSVEHGLMQGQLTRLWTLVYHDGVLVVEIVEQDGPDDGNNLTEVVKTFRFSE